jgi:hypothetical protein
MKSFEILRIFEVDFKARLKDSKTQRISRMFTERDTSLREASSTHPFFGW